MRIALIRHGQTDWNARGLLQGTSDIPLNEAGRRQAMQAAARIAGQGYERVVSSPLGRAVETAQIIARELGLPTEIETIPDLIERHYGDGEGKPTKHPDGTWAVEEYGNKEPVARVAERGYQALEDIARSASAAGVTNVIAVSHGTTIRLTCDVIAGDELPSVNNATASVVVGEPGAWTLETYNNLPVVAAERLGYRGDAPLPEAVSDEIRERVDAEVEGETGRAA